MIVLVILGAILAFTIATLLTCLLMERAYASTLRPFVTLFSAAAVGSLALWLLQGGAAEAKSTLSDGLSPGTFLLVIAGGVAAGVLISGI